MGEGDETGLDECRETVEQLQVEKQKLQEENEVLRESAEGFGELAERLNTALKESTVTNR
jgi:cell division septum initiation protein DivIVA